EDGIRDDLVTGVQTCALPIFVCAGVWMLRRTDPELPRPFKTPLVPFVPIMGALISLLMMAGLPGDTWLRLIIWLIIGMVIYFSYGRHHSRVQRAEATREPKPPPSMADHKYCD